MLTDVANHPQRLESGCAQKAACKSKDTSQQLSHPTSHNNNHKVFRQLPCHCYAHSNAVPPVVSNRNVWNCSSQELFLCAYGYNQHTIRSEENFHPSVVASEQAEKTTNFSEKEF